jgi:hypothetical protein
MAKCCALWQNFGTDIPRDLVLSPRSVGAPARLHTYVSTVLGIMTVYFIISMTRPYTYRE